MYHFERTTTVKTVAEMPAAMKFAADITGYLNKQYSLDMHFGAELFGEPRVHWYFDVESLDKLSGLAGTLLADTKYNEMLIKAEKLWVDGAAHDTIVNMAA